MQKNLQVSSVQYCQSEEKKLTCLEKYGTLARTEFYQFAFVQNRHTECRNTTPRSIWIKFFSSSFFAFFPHLVAFFPTLVSQIFPTLDVRMGPAISLHLGQMSAPVGNAVFSLFCLKYLVPVLASVLCSNATVQRIFRSGQSRVRRRYSIYSSASSSFELTK